MLRQKRKQQKVRARNYDILFVTFLVLLVIGAPIALCLGAAALLVVFTTGDVSPIVLGQRMFGSLDSFTIMAIPLFMLAGNLMSSGGISKRLTDFCDAILGWMPGIDSVLYDFWSIIRFSDSNLCCNRKYYGAGDD